MPASPSGYETLPGGSLSPDTPNLAPPIQADYAQRRSVWDRQAGRQARAAAAERRPSLARAASPSFSLVCCAGPRHGVQCTRSSYRGPEQHTNRRLLAGISLSYRSLVRCGVAAANPEFPLPSSAPCVSPSLPCLFTALNLAREPLPPADSRLQPRDTRLTAAFLLVFACVVAGAVFVAVPRGVSVGEISVTTDRMSWNTTKVRPCGAWLGDRPASCVRALAVGISWGCYHTHGG